MVKSPICPTIAKAENFAGMQLQFDWTNLYEFFIRYSVVDSCSAVWVTPYLTPPILFFEGGVKSDFLTAISSHLTSKLSTDVLYLLSV